MKGLINKLGYYFKYILTYINSKYIQVKKYNINFTLEIIFYNIIV